MTGVSMKQAIVTGASSGLGKLIADRLSNDGWEVHNWSLDQGVDVSDAKSVVAAASGFNSCPLDVLVNCAGINGNDYLPQVSEDDFDKIMDTNAKSIFLTTASLLPNLRGGTVLNIVSNAAHVPMTTSLAYNMSKAAALMATKQLARELKKTHDITVFSISPNKLRGTGMSKDIEEAVCRLRGWTKEEAATYQLAALPAGVETDPVTLAEFIGFLLSTKERHRYLAGCDIPYGGPTI